MGYGDYSKIDFNTYAQQYTAPTYTVDNTNYVNRYVSGRYSYSPNSIYSNSNKTKSAEQQTYDAWDAWLRRYGNIQYQTSQSNGSTQADANESKVFSKLTDDTKIPVDLGNGKTAEITYKDLNENIAAYTNKIEHQEKELKKIKENTDENGNARITDDTPLSEMSFWQKAGKVGAGLINGGFKFVKSFLGMEDGWKGFKNGGWKRCLANVGIAAGTLALMAIPGVGPVLGTTFLWLTRGDAIVNAGKGIYKMCTAETAGELEAGAENIGVALVEIAGGKAASKRIRIKGGQKGGKLGLFKKFKAEWQATKTLIKDEKRAYQMIKNTSKDKGLFGKLLKFAKFKKYQNKKYCANKVAYEEQKAQMLKELNNPQNNTKSKRGLFGRLFSKNNSLKPRTGNTNDKAVTDKIAEIETRLNDWRKQRIEFGTKKQMDKAIYEQKGTLKEAFKQEIADVLEGKGTLGQQIKNDEKAKALFLQEMERLMAEEKQFNRQYHSFWNPNSLYKTRQRAMGAQLIRNINPDEVAVYTGKPDKFGQLYALNSKPAEMGWFRWLSKFGFKTFWDGAMLTYNAGKSIVGTPFAAYPMIRHHAHPHEFEGEFRSQKDIAELEQKTETNKNQLAQLEEIKKQAEKYYA